MTFYVRAPIFVFREFMRHRTFSYNEESGRYRRLEPEFYVPGPARKLVQRGKPGAYEFTDGTAAQHQLVDEAVRKSCRTAYAAYLEMLGAGVAREVARTVLPVSRLNIGHIVLSHFTENNGLWERNRLPHYPRRKDWQMAVAPVKAAPTKSALRTGALGFPALLAQSVALISPNQAEA
jgi:thymidylate synthase (FAD)